MIQFYGHSTCTTCKMAEKWLEERGIAYEWKNIKETTPDREVLRDILETEKLTTKRLFNTSGNLYKELGLKDKIETMSLEGKLDLLESDGMLIRRPFLFDGNTVSVGYNEDMFNEIWK